MSIEEQKIRKGVRPGNEGFPGGDAERRSKIGGPLRSEFERDAGHGVAKRKPGSVERLPAGRPLQRVRRSPSRPRDATASSASVDGIAHHGVSGVLEMDPDLMGATGMELEAEEINGGKPGDHVRVGARRPPGGRNRHSLAVARMAGDWRLDHGGTLREMAPRQRCVRAGDATLPEQVTEPAVREIGFGDQHEARGVAIEPVHDPRSALHATAQSRAASDKRVHQGVVPMTGRRVHDQARGFVDDREVLVLPHDGERNVRGSELPRWLARREDDGDLLTPGEHARGTRRDTTYRDGFVGDESGGLGAGELELVGEEAVEAFGLIGANAEIE
jgi:hypothetical protein